MMGEGNMLHNVRVVFWVQLKKLQYDLKQSKRRTRGMRGLQNPKCFSCVCDHLIIPFDLQMSWGSFQQRRAREVVYIQFWFWRHVDFLLQSI